MSPEALALMFVNGTTGSIDVTGGSIWYWLVRSRTNRGILWMQGGPGASSLEGMFKSNLGPVTLRNGVFGASQSPWSQMADIVFWEAPAGLGFSKASDLHYNDDRFAVQAGDFLRELVTRHPRDRWYVAGESYAGVMVPVAARQVPHLLTGLIVINGCTGTGAGPCGPGRAERTLDVLARTGHVTTRTRDRVKECNCRDAFVAASKEAGPLNTYNVNVSCLEGETLLDFACGHSEQWACPSRYRRKRCRNQTIDYCACRDPSLSRYLDRPDVRSALGVSRETKRGHIVYRRTAFDVRPVYADLIVNWSLRVLVMAGDLDAQVPAEATNDWVRSLGFQVKSTEHSHDADIIEYAPPSGSLAVATVFGAGHAITKYQPHVASRLLSRFLHGML